MKSIKNLQNHGYDSESFLEKFPKLDKFNKEQYIALLN